jgi:hypothetical protein
MIIAFYPGAGGNRYLKKMTGQEWITPGVSYDNQVLGQLYLHRYLLENQTPEKNNGHILTHCMNSARIQQMFPDTPIVFINSSIQQSLRREWQLAGHARFLNKKIKSVISRLEHYNQIKDPSWPELTSNDQLKSLPDWILTEINIDYNKIVNNVIDVPGMLYDLTQQCIDEINSAYEIITWHLDYYQKFPTDFSGATQILDIDREQTDFSLVMQQELGLYQSQIFDRVWKKINEQ